MEKHIGHDTQFGSVGEFQYKVNQSAGIPKGGRDLATARQLATAAGYACARVREHCEAADHPPAPPWATGGEDDE